MANYMGSTFENTSVGSNINLPLITQVLATKQGAYNANKDQIKQTLQAYGNIDLARDIDKEYVATKLSDVKNAIANIGNRDLSQAFVTDDIMSMVRNVAQDPFVLEAIQNTKKLRTFQAGVEEIKKKNPEKYNNANYNDAIELSGADKWQKGEINSFGTLQYNNYTNAAGNIDKKVQEYVNKFQMTPHYLGTDTSNPLYYTDKTGIKVSKDDVLNYAYSSLDQETRVQLQIDARQTVGKYDDATFNAYIKDYKDYELQSDNNKIAALEAEKKTKTVEEQKAYESAINTLKQKASGISESIAKGKFDRGEMYSVYQSKLLDGIASNYDVEMVTSIKRDDMPFQVYKFGVETQFKEQELAMKQTELQLKVQANTLAKQANDIASGATAVDILTNTEEDEVSPERAVSSELVKADKALDTYLKRTNPSNYNDKSPEEQWNYKVAHQLLNPTNAEADPTLNSLLINFKNSRKAYVDIYNPAIKKTDDVYVNGYNNLIGGRNLDLNNLKNSAPLTASLLASKRPFNRLSAAEQSGVKIEMMQNSLRYGAVTDERQRDLVSKAIIREQVQLTNNRSDQADTIRKQLSTATNTEKVSFLNSVANVYGLIGRGAKNYLLDPVAEGFQDIGRRAIYGEEAADNAANAYAQGQVQDERQMATNIQNIGSYIQSFGTDSNLNDIQRRDFKAGSNIEQNSLSDYFKDKLTAIGDNVKNQAVNYKSNYVSDKAFVFSSDIKAQKNAVEVVRQQLLASGDAPAGFEKAKSFSISRDGEQFKVAYTDKDGNVITSLQATLPEAITKNMDLRNVNWAINANNPNIDLQPEIIAPINNVTARTQSVNNAIRNAQGYLQPQALDALKLKPQNTFMATTEEIKKYQIAQNSDLGQEFLNQNLPQIDAILNNKYEAEPFTYNGEFRMKIKYIEEGQAKEFSDFPALGTQYDPDKFYLDYLNYTHAYKMLKIAELKQD